jgi:hypothetical protein
MKLATLQKALRKIAYFESWADLPIDSPERAAYESLLVKLKMKMRGGLMYNQMSDNVQKS